MVQYTKVAKRTAQHVAIFGDPKSGKSTLASRLAEAGWNLIWFSCDNGHTVLDKLSVAAQERINLVRIADTKENPIAIHTVTKCTDGGRYSICDTHGIINCTSCRFASKTDSGVGFTDINLNEVRADTIVVIDHMSQVSDSAINAISKKEALAAKKDVDGYKLDYGDWALQGAMMARILSNVQQAPYHCICLFHSAEVEMEDGQKKLVPQVGTLNFSRNSGKYFDHVVYMGVRNHKHVVGSKTLFMHNVQTGSRTDAVMEEGTPDLVKIFGRPPVGLVDASPSGPSGVSPMVEQKVGDNAQTAAVTGGQGLPAVVEDDRKEQQQSSGPPLTATATASGALAALAKLKGKG